MKIQLPKLSSTGFTLIELMIAITIIAVLAAVGFVAFQGITARARDDRRIADLNSIRNAMETAYTNGAYVDLAAASFSSGVIPVDPIDGQAKCAGTSICRYCVQGSTGVVGDACGTATVGPGQPAAGSAYVVCANLESATVNGQNFYCVSSAQ